jgi:hypothetical protein
MTIDVAGALARDEMTFGEAWAEVMTEAIRLGASYLSEAHYEALSDWLGALLLVEADRVQDETDAADALVARLLREPSRLKLRAAVRTYLNGG